MEDEGAPPQPEARRIVVVDDDEGRRTMLARLLAQDGYEVECLPDGQGLVERLRASPPDLVILDLMLPGISGFDLCTSLRALEELRLTPILLVTSAHVDEASVVRGLFCGADDYVVTPTRLEELRARIRVQLRNRRDRELLQWARARGAGFRNAAMLDPLTGLANRRALDEALAQAVRAPEAFLVALIDVDHFKVVNDTYGHTVGDGVLVQVGRAIATRARAPDVAGRWGGEEFLVLVRGAPEDVAESIGERYRAVVAALDIDGLRVTASVGVASFPAGAPRPTAVDAVAAADTALYEAKRAGRDRVVVAAPGAVAR